ncbi:hypothetical protein [uncultured Oscillibacter sp.]|uniref:hypothetical protein n=1 Tax=uncultured Oscillibacter sp. TaxID=876091 RepID=UPI0025EB4693|nr:hypothetical protein [uncultured Oscillibacter sp.]
MIWWVLAAVAALVVVLLRARVGVRLSAAPGNLTVDLCLGPFRIRLLPAGETPKAAAETTAAEAEETAEAAGRVLPKVDAQTVADAVKALWPPLRRALERTRRAIRVRPFRLSVTVGAAGDPAAGAVLYGRLQAAVWTGMPVLERLLVIPDPYIHTGLDFDRPDTVLEGTVGVSLPIGTLLGVAAGVGLPALRWFLRLQKQQKKMPPAQTPSGRAA